MSGFVGACGTLPIRCRGFRMKATSTDSRHDSVGHLAGVQGVCNTDHTAELSRFLAIDSRTLLPDVECESLDFSLSLVNLCDAL